MADVSPIPVADWGSLMSSFGNGQAQQAQAYAGAGLAQAQTGLVGQQTQSADLQNQIMRMRLPLIQQAINSFNTTPQGGSDASGATSPGGAPIAQDERGDKNWYDPALIDNGLRQRFYVNPQGTQQDLQRITLAGLSGDPGLLEAAKAQRDIGTGQRVQASQNDANQMYETMSSVADAPDGQALTALARVSPTAAARIKALMPDGMEEDAAARQFADHVASTVHQYTGRPIKPDKAGVYRDEVTGKPVTGLPTAGMDQEQWTKLAEEGNAMIPIKNSDGTETMVHRYSAEGAKTLPQWMNQVAAQRGAPGASPTITGAPKAQAQAQIATAAKNVVKPGQPPTPASTIASVATNPNILPAISTLPPAPKFAARPMSTPNPQEQATMDAYKENYKSVQTDAQRTLAESNQTDALIVPMQEKLNTVNPRDVGPGSSVYKAFLELKDAVTKDNPKDLVDMGVLDKFANQLGVQNVRNLLSGQKITNQEMMNFLTRASASTTQPLDVMKTIIAYQKANNDFDRKYATTALAALAANKDPGSISSLQNGRTAYVQQSMDRDMYPTPQSVKAAFQSGQLTRDEAKRILQTQHGMQ